MDAILSIIVPTYNEKQNLEELSRRIDDSLKDYELIIVDDDSPDGTAEDAERIASETGRNIRVVHRESDPGLSKSVVAGLETADGDTAVVMDADLQHPPEKIQDLASKVTDDTPVAVGTRYNGEGGIDDWSLSRKIVSWGASTISKIMIPSTRELSDPMSGFFAVKIDRLDTEKLDPHGYKILLDVLTQLNPDEIPEVGYHFSDREEGESKLDIHQYVKFLEHAFECRMRTHGLEKHIDPRRTVRFLEFAGVGATGTAINTAIFFLGRSSGLHYLTAGFFAFLVAVQWNFFWNWLITFDKPEDRLITRYINFHGVSAGGFVVYEILLATLIGLFGVWDILANVLAIFGGFLWNFIGSERIAFRRHE